jgi:hypothetical protein
MCNSEPALKFFCISLYYILPLGPNRHSHWTFDNEEDFEKNFARLMKRHSKLVKPHKARLIAEEAVDGKWVEIMRWEKVSL